MWGEIRGKTCRSQRKDGRVGKRGDINEDVSGMKTFISILFGFLIGWFVIATFGAIGRSKYVEYRRSENGYVIYVDEPCFDYPYEGTYMYRDATLGVMRENGISLSDVTHEKTNKWCKNVYLQVIEKRLAYRVPSRECWKWALGDKYGVERISRIDYEWNKLHEDIFHINGIDDLYETYDRIAGACEDRGIE